MSKRRSDVCLRGFLEFGYHTVKFLHEVPRPFAAQDSCNFAVVPESSVLSALETIPYRMAVLPEVRKDLARVVEFVCRGHEQNRRIRVS